MHTNDFSTESIVADSLSTIQATFITNWIFFPYIFCEFVGVKIAMEIRP